MLVVDEILDAVNSLHVADYADVSIAPSEGYDFRSGGYTCVVAEYELNVNGWGKEFSIPLVLLDTDEIKIVDHPDNEFSSMPVLDSESVWAYLFFEVL